MCGLRLRDQEAGGEVAAGGIGGIRDGAMLFDVPEFTLAKVCFTAIGCMGYWSLKGRDELRSFALSEVIAHLPIQSPNRRYLVEVLCFITLGCLVGIAVTDPHSARQAIAAGVAWTGVFTSRAVQPSAVTRDRAGSKVATARAGT